MQTQIQQWDCYESLKRKQPVPDGDLWWKTRKDMLKYVGMKLDLKHPKPIGHTKEDEVVGKQKIGEWAKKAVQSKWNKEIEEEKWQGKLMANRWN